MTSNYFNGSATKHFAKSLHSFAPQLKRLFLPLQHSHLSPLSTITTEEPHESTHSREQALLSLFKPCSNMNHLKQIHAQIIQFGFDQHIFVVGKLITFCSVSENGSMDYALSVFDQIKYPDGFIWNTMIRGFGKTHKPEEAFGFYKRMLNYGKIADNFTFSSLIKISGQLIAIEMGRQIHASSLKYGLDSHIFVRNTLIHMYVLFRDLETAHRLFEEIPKLDLVSWNSIINGCVYCGRYKEALRLFWRMQRNGFEPDEATYVVVLSACSNLAAADFGRWVHSLIEGNGLDHVVSVSNSLIDMYAKCGEMDEARKIFENMEIRNVVSWNSIILGHATHGHAEEALELFSRMRKWEFGEPDEVTFLGVLCACSRGGLLDEGRKYFNSMQTEYFISPTIKHYGCMVDLLGRAGLVKEAYELIQSMPMECNAVVWRTLLGACRVHEDLELGERVRSHLLELEPDHSGDYVLLSNMYAGAGQWTDVAREREAMRGRGVQKPKPGNSLIDVHHTMGLKHNSRCQTSCVDATT